MGFRRSTFTGDAKLANACLCCLCVLPAATLESGVFALGLGSQVTGEASLLFAAQYSHLLTLDVFLPFLRVDHGMQKMARQNATTSETNDGVHENDGGYNIQIGRASCRERV